MNSHEDGSSWFMKCELGAESLRPRWGRRGATGGLRGTNSRLCWRGSETPRPPVIPPPPPPPPPPLRSDSRPVRSFTGASGAAAALASDDLWKRGQIAMWGSTPQRPASCSRRLLCVCAGRQASFMSHGGLIECWIIHQEHKYLLWFQ